MIVAGAALGTAACFPEVGGRWPVVADSCRDPTGSLVPPANADVAEVQRADSVTGDPATQRATIDGAVVGQMLDALLAALVPTGPAWRAVLPDWTPETRIGLKINVLNEQCPTSVELTKTVVDSLVAQLGASRERIIVWDRRLDELTRCGFTEAAVGAKVMGTVNTTAGTGGPGYGDPSCGVVAGRAPRLSRILTEFTDVTINLPVLKTHAICGVTGALKNIYGVIDNPGDYHQNLNTALPELYALPPIRRSFRFHLLDALVAVTTGGTSSPSDTVPRRLVGSIDPVALDRYALALADRLRDEKQLGLGPVDRTYTKWMENAEAAGLGSTTYQLKSLP